MAQPTIEAHDRSRGRDADAPHEIPVRGWKDVLLRVKDEARDDDLSLLAGGVAFFALLSLAPALAAVVAIYGLVTTPEDVARQIDQVGSSLPDSARQVLSDQLHQVVSTSRSGLGAALIVGIVLALWSASAAMKHLLGALTLINDEHETRGFVKMRGTALVLTLGAIVFAGVSLALITAVPQWANSTDNEALATTISIVRWPVLAVLMLVALSVLYRYGPDRDEPHWRWVTWGAVVATVLWIIGSALFSLYASRFGSYNKTYGSMAAVAVMMLWLYLTATCVLLGAELNAELEHQTARDSTKGRPEPLGRRDATMADTVGADRG
jgi:membrane protein